MHEPSAQVKLNLRDRMRLKETGSSRHAVRERQWHSTIPVFKGESLELVKATVPQAPLSSHGFWPTYSSSEPQHKRGQY
ncbi:hypothetical protein SKAU_G00330360 [Synaphobranchus kaupii]|uniref:Uncharacterized protein n=1 Tax=Synaphobranchus kaupii TaxID=118154 RepID=A0A9Q1IIJ4_SYNKA|nr:hypothetical protein SKAU_G00330360 [Synaphobranchus kaupii]